MVTESLSGEGKVYKQIIAWTLKVETSVPPAERV